MALRIHVLPSALVDQIAAGEVVERPASVVKELVENSLDAGATRISCRVESGGLKQIQVVDDGEGMSREDVALAVVRHATSKIAELEDLGRIRTLGFRGEALPSIAAVSRFRIVSRRREDPVGTELRLEGGREPELFEIGAPVGTQVDVQELFFNTPARRKFLRGAATEMAHSHGWLTRLGLVQPQVHLRLEHGPRLVLDAPGSADLAQRAAALLGRDVFEHLYAVEFSDGSVRVDGLVSDPELSRTNPRDMYMFVNGRFVRDRLLQHAAMQAFRALLPNGRFPVVILRVQIEPGEVDVNVHPQKTEVRFSNGDRVHHAVTSAVASVLARSPWLRNTRTYSVHLQSGKNGVAGQQADRVREALSRYESGVRSRSGFAGSRNPVAPRTSIPLPLRTETLGEELLPIGWRHLGTLWATYLLLAVDDRLVLVDQHAAHERVTFERLKAAAENGMVGSQRLLVPVQLTVDGGLMSVLEAQREKLSAVGMEVEPFGESTINVSAVPSLLANAPVTPLVRDALGELAELDQSTPWEVARLELLGRMACHASVRAGQTLTEPEIRSLLSELARVDFASRCPHGRPVMVEFTRGEVEGWFRRS